MAATGADAERPAPLAPTIRGVSALRAVEATSLVVPLDGPAKRTDWSASPTETIRMTVDASTAETKGRAAAPTEGATAPPSARSTLACPVGAHSTRAAMDRHRVARELATALDSSPPASRDDRTRYRHGRDHFVT